MEENGGVEMEIKQILNAAWGNWKIYSGALCDRKIRVTFKGRTAKASTKVCVSNTGAPLGCVLSQFSLHLVYCRSVGVLIHLPNL